jgi:hypothetical protein
MNLEIRPIENLSELAWDQLLFQSPDWMVYQTSPWLRFVCELCRGRALHLGIYADGRLVGHWAAVAFRKGPFRLVGSPMRGWHTPVMGPFGAALAAISASELLCAWRAFLVAAKIHHAEFANPRFDAVADGCEGFEVEQHSTYMCPIPPTEEGILAQFHESCRAAARRALRRGVVVESTDNPAFLNHFYYQLEAVFGKQGLKPTHPKAHFKMLWRHLKPTGRLLTIWAKLEGKIIGTGIYVIGNGVLRGIASSSLRTTQHHYPNEPIRLVAMRIAAEHGCTFHDLAGLGDYKTKFGAHLEPFNELRYYRGAWVKASRKLYAKLLTFRLRRGIVATATPRRPPLEEDYPFEP